MLSWMNLLTLLLVYLSSLYFTLLSSNLFLSCGGRNRTIPLQREHSEVKGGGTLTTLQHICRPAHSVWTLWLWRRASELV